MTSIKLSDIQKQRWQFILIQYEGVKATTGLSYLVRKKLFRTAAEMATVKTMQDTTRAFARQIPLYAKEVLISVLPILAVYADGCRCWIK